MFNIIRIIFLLLYNIIKYNNYLVIFIFKLLLFIITINNYLNENKKILS